MEQWNPIPGYEGYYSASNFGQIRRDKPEANTYSGKIIAPNKKGRYPRIGLTKNGFKKMFSVHRLIAITFLGNPPLNYMVNHKDGNKQNNTLKNLEWVTAKENMAHSLKNGFNPQGSRAYNAKLNESQVRKIRIRYAQEKISQQKLANEFNVSQVLISVILLRKRWKHI